MEIGDRNEADAVEEIARVLYGMMYHIHLPEDVKKHWSRHVSEGASLEADWNTKFAEYAKKYAADAAELKSIIEGTLPTDWEKALPALVFLLALIVRGANRPDDYDSDDEFRPAPPAAGPPVAGALDQRPSRNDAWSTRMREKYGLDTAEFTYKPAEAGRLQPVSAQPTEERSR